MAGQMKMPCTEECMVFVVFASLVVLLTCTLMVVSMCPYGKSTKYNYSQEMITRMEDNLQHIRNNTKQTIESKPRESRQISVDLIHA